MMMFICLSVFSAGLCIAAEENGVFNHTFSLGVTLTDGNSDTLQADASLVTEWEKDGFGSIRAGVQGNYGESTVNSNKETTVENARAFAGLKKNAGERIFASFSSEALYDEIASVDYRAVAGLGAGFYSVKNAETDLSLEAGPSYVWEEVAGQSDDYFALYFEERFEHRISKTAKIWQSVRYTPKADDFDDYLLNGEMGVEAAISARSSIRVLVRDGYDSTPGPGLQKNDVSLITGISMSI
ncbi:MAG: DUF481 domain-containing protein [Kiritimatiellia bacterium]